MCRWELSLKKEKIIFYGNLYICVAIHKSVRNESIFFQTGAYDYYCGKKDHSLNKIKSCNITFAFEILLSYILFSSVNLFCSTNDFRNAFIKTIRQTIRESVRNMSIPANKAPQPPKIPINGVSVSRASISVITGKIFKLRVSSLNRKILIFLCIICIVDIFRKNNWEIAIRRSDNENRR